MSALLVPVLSLLIAAAALAAAIRLGTRARAARAAMLDACGALIEAPVLGRDGSGYPTLDGRFGGVPVAVRLMAEAVAFRRLPQLWLSVSVHAPTGQGATLDLLRRASGIEFYAPSDLPVRPPVPEGWPADVSLAGSRGAPALLDRAAPALAGLLADPRIKEVLIAPRGVRIVTQLCEGERGAYLLLRESRFALTRIEPEILLPHLFRAAELSRRLGAAAPGERHDPLVRPSDVKPRVAA